MKKTVLAILTACTLISTAHAQTAVVVRRPSLLSDLAETVGALVALPIVLPIAVAEGVVSGTAEAADTILHGREEVYVVPSQPVVAPAPVVVAPAAPAVVTPAPVVAPAPVVVAPQQVTTVTTSTRYVTTTVTRPASTFEVGVPVIPAPVEYRAAPRPVVRYRVAPRR